MEVLLDTWSLTLSLVSPGNVISMKEKVEISEALTNLSDDSDDELS